MSALLLGLDIGTTATKCVLVDPGQGIVAEAARPGGAGVGTSWLGGGRPGHVVASCM
jgi:hypothetical protein